MPNDYDDRIRAEYAEQKARFYADPKFAAIVGVVVGFIAGALIF